MKCLRTGAGSGGKPVFSIPTGIRLFYFEQAKIARTRRGAFLKKTEASLLSAFLTVDGSRYNPSGISGTFSTGIESLNLNVLKAFAISGDAYG